MLPEVALAYSVFYFVSFSTRQPHEDVDLSTRGPDGAKTSANVSTTSSFWRLPKSWAKRFTASMYCSLDPNWRHISNRILKDSCQYYNKD
jgi:hypothetical protein